MNKRIGVLIGSLREGSYNRAIAEAVASLLPEDYEVVEVEIENLPFYNEDLDHEGKTPQEWTEFREKVSTLDAFILATPEYNRSTAPALKNALDVGSRPYGQSVWTQKPALITTASMGGIGGFGANHHLRQSLVFLDMPVVQQPEVYIGAAHNVVDENGKITDQETLGFLQTAADTFVELINRY